MLLVTLQREHVPLAATHRITDLGLSERRGVEVVGPYPAEGVRGRLATLLTLPIHQTLPSGRRSAV